MSPTLFKPASIANLVAYLSEIGQSAANTPLLYYDINILTGVVCKYSNTSYNRVRLMRIVTSSKDMKKSYFLPLLQLTEPRVSPLSEFHLSESFTSQRVSPLSEFHLSASFTSQRVSPLSESHWVNTTLIKRQCPVWGSFFGIGEHLPAWQGNSPFKSTE